jgi:hypothetical protein
MHSIFDPVNNQSSNSISERSSDELNSDEELGHKNAGDIEDELSTQYYTSADSDNESILSSTGYYQPAGNEAPELPPSTGHYESTKDTYEIDSRYDGHYTAAAGNNGFENEDEALNINLALENVRLLEAYNKETNRALVRYTVEQKQIEKRLQDAHALNSELLKIKEDLKRGDTTSLDQYEELIEAFQEKHWPAMKKTHKGVITEDQNPFPVGFDIEGSTREAVDNAIDKLGALVKLEETALTDLSRKFQMLIERDAIVSNAMTNPTDGGTKKIVDNMSRG